MLMCPTCHERAEHRVYENDNDTFPAGPEIRVCHADDGAYLHVVGE